MVLVIAARLPSLHSHLPLVRSGPTGLPAPLLPWHPSQGALATWPWKMRFPSATCAAVAPGGTGSAPAACAPASGWMPSGGTAPPAAPVDALSARRDGAGAAATDAVAGPRYVTRQMRPRWSSEM